MRKQQTQVLFSLFMRTNGKCNNSQAPSTGLSGILPSSEPQIPEENINTILMHSWQFNQIQFIDKHAGLRML